MAGQRRLSWLLSWRSYEERLAHICGALPAGARECRTPFWVLVSIGPLVGWSRR